MAPTRPIFLSVAVIAAFTLARGTAQATFPGANGRIAYTLDSFEPLGSVSSQSIHTVLSIGADDRTLASGSDPAWSRDGTRIAFAGIDDLEGCPFGMCQSDIFTMRAGGSDQRLLTRSGESESSPGFSPSGGRIVFDRTRSDRGGGEATRIVSVRAVDGSDPRVLAGNNQLRGGWNGAFDPEYAPDGRHIVYVAAPYPSTPAIYTMRPDGSHKQRLVRVPDSSPRRIFPDYSPDGRHIVFQRFVKKWGITGTVVMRSDGSHRKAVPLGEVSAPVYSPRGGKFVAGRDGNIYTMPSHPTDNPGFQRIPATTYGNGDFARNPSWQPTPGG